MGKCLRKSRTCSSHGLFCIDSKGTRYLSFMEKTADVMVFCHRLQSGFTLIAHAGDEGGAARVKRAARRPGIGMWDTLHNGGQTLARGSLHARNGLQQSLGIGMLGRMKDIVHWGAFVDLPQIPQPVTSPPKGLSTSGLLCLPWL